MTKPLVSIICITYNHAKFIAQAIEGFLLQKTNFPIEIIIHDDCSTDNTQEIIQSYADKYPKLIKTIFQKKNQYSLGVPMFPSVFPYCKGKYIAHCEGDDYWTDPHKLQRQVDFLEKNSKYILVAENSIWYGISDNKKYNFSDFPERDISITEMLDKRQFSTASVLYRNLGDRLQPPNGISGDTILWCHFTNFGKIKYLENVSSVYRRHIGGVTGGDKVQWAKKMIAWNNALSQNHPEISQTIFNKRNLSNFNDAIDYLIRNKSYALALSAIDDLTCLTSDPHYFKNELFSYLEKSLLSTFNNNRLQLQKKEKQLYDIQHSLSLKVGRVITFPIRWVNDIPNKITALQYKFELYFNKNKRELKDKGVVFIDKKKIIKESKSLSPLLAVDNNKTPKLIVSLTSFPERIPEIFYNLYSLLSQTIKPDILILWLAEEQFPNKEKDLPQLVLNLKKYGLTIKWCKDIKSYKKLIFSLKEFPDDIIVTADDDIYYPDNWLELLYNSYLRDPQYIHCHRAHRIETNDAGQVNSYNEWDKCITNNEASYLNFFTGAGGVLYPPNSLYEDVLNEELFMKLAPTADDIWFWAMAVLNNTKIRIINNHITDFIFVDPELEFRMTDATSLYKINILKNDEQLKNSIDYYRTNILKKLTDSKNIITDS